MVSSVVVYFAQAEALAEFTDVQMALNLHVNEEVRQRIACERMDCLCVGGLNSLLSPPRVNPERSANVGTAAFKSLPCCFLVPGSRSHQLSIQAQKLNVVLLPRRS